MTRLTRILSDADTDLAELWMVLSVLAFGLAITNPWANIYAAGPAFRALQEARVPEWAFGVMTMIAAGVHLSILLWRGYLGRLLAMGMQTTGCAGTAALLAYGNPRGYGWWLFAVAAVMGLVLVGRLAALVETARHWQGQPAAVWAEKTTGGSRR